MTYEQTHPWITFRLDLRQADWGLWLDLGEAASKCEHLAGAPLQPEVAQRLHEIFLAKGAAGTTAIEGNTLSEAQVLQHIRGELHLPPSQAYLQQEVENIVPAMASLRPLWGQRPRRCSAPSCCADTTGRCWKAWS